MNRVLKRLGLAAVILAAATAPAFAHLNPEEHGSVMAGISHPLFGLDHVLAMVAVGLWAAMIGGRAVWLVPATFVAVMAMGFAVALLGGSLPFVEPAILASVIALGFLVAAAIRLPVGGGMAIAAGFALFHGFAHGGEAGAATHLSFGVGFALSTALLHLVGVGTGLLFASGLILPKRNGRTVARVLGAAAALLGIGLVAGWV